MGRAREIGLGLAGAPDPREPGLAIGYPRFLELLNGLGLKGTFFIEGWNALHHPDRILDLVARGHEVGLHGWVHEKFGALAKPQAEQVLHDGTAAMLRIGVRPLGFRAPGAIRGPHAAGILSELGYRYDSSTNHEQTSPNESTDFAGALEPALLSPTLAHVPWRYSMVDSVQYLRNAAGPVAPRALEAKWLRMIDRAAETRCTMTLVLHPHVSGVDDERFSVARTVLNHARANAGIEVCTASALAKRAFDEA